MLGKVVAYYPKKGYGFIQGDDGNKYFVPYCNIKTASGGLVKGCTVEFTKSSVGNKAYDVRFA